VHQRACCNPRCLTSLLLLLALAQAPPRFVFLTRACTSARIGFSAVRSCPCRWSRVELAHPDGLVLEQQDWNWRWSPSRWPRARHHAAGLLRAHWSGKRLLADVHLSRVLLVGSRSWRRPCFCWSRRSCIVPGESREASEFELGLFQSDHLDFARPVRDATGARSLGGAQEFQRQFIRRSVVEALQHLTIDGL